MITIPQSPDIGEMLKTFIKTNRKYKSGIANWLGVGKSTVHSYLNKPDMKINTLWRLCHVLQYDFFGRLSQQLPPEFTAVTENPLKERVAELENEKHDLELQVKTLKEAIELMGGKK